MAQPHIPSQDILRQLYESMTDGVVGFDGEDRIVFCNPGMCVITGRSLEEILGKTSEEAWGVTIQFPDTLRASAISEQAIKRPNGMVRHVSIKTFPLAGTGGLKVAIYRDVSRSRNAMESLRRAEERLHDLLEALPVILWTADLNLVLTSSLGAGLEALKYRPNEHQGANLFRFFNTEDPDFAPIWATFRAHGGNSQHLHFEWGGRRFDAQVSPMRRLGGEIIGTVGIAQDVTEKTRLSEDLETTAREYRLLFSESPVGNFVFSPTGRLLNCNEQFLRIMGFESTDAARRAINLTHWTTAEGRNCFRLLMDDRSFNRQAVKARRANGVLVSLEASIHGRFDDDGGLIVAQGSITDLTVSRKLERTLSRSEAQLQGVLSLCSVALMHLSPRGRVLDIRADGLAAHARDLQEFHGKRLADCLEEPCGDLLVKSLEEVKSSGGVCHLDLALPLSGGATLALGGRLSGAPEAGFLLLLSPPSQSGGVPAEAERDAVREGFGGLIGPIAHEFNNHLMGILGHAGLALLDLPEGNQALESIRAIEESALAASEVTAGLLAGTWQTSGLEPVSIPRVLDQLPGSLAEHLPANQLPQTHCPQELPPARGVGVQFLLLLSNLSRVATGRLRGGSSLRIEADTVSVCVEELADCLGDAPPEGGDYIRIALLGEAGDGTNTRGDRPGDCHLIAAGLGIVRAHKGYIRSGAGMNGACLYEIFLPVDSMQGTETPPPTDMAGGEPEAGPPAPSGLVLLADSEGDAARSAVSVLADCALDYVRAHDRDDLLDSYRRHGDTLIAVLLDDSLKGGKGRSIVEELTAINPDVPILLITQEDFRPELPSTANLDHLRRPLQPNELARKLMYFKTLRGIRMDTGLH